MTQGSTTRPRVRVVMFVERRPAMRACYATALRESGFLVDEVASLTEALELAPRVRPDAIILSRELRGGDSWDVARKLKAVDSTRNTQIVAFSSYSERADMERALVAGCDSFVETPCDPRVLVRHVRGLLDMDLDEDDETVAAIA